MGFKPYATKPQSSLDDYEFFSTIKRYLDLSASFSFSRSISSISRHQLSSYSISKELSREKVSNNSFENMPIFHDGPIFDQDENEKNGPRYTFERVFTPLVFSYDMVLKTL